MCERVNGEREEREQKIKTKKERNYAKEINGWKSQKKIINRIRQLK